MPYQLTEKDVLDLAIGTGFLGSGGGGNTRIGKVITRDAIKKGTEIVIEKLAEIADEALVIAVGVMGAPSVLVEKLPSKEECINVIKNMEEVLGQKISHAIPLEIGGMNGLYAIYVASQAQKTIIDGDCMGRAFPELQMVTPNIYGKIERCVAVLANGQTSRVLTADNLPDLELLARKETTEMGGIVTIAYLPMRGKEARECCVPNSISVAKKIGAGLQVRANRNFLSEVNKILEGTQYGPMETIMTGKIVDLKRDLQDGFNKGWVIIEVSSGWPRIRIDFQNENLRAVDLKTQTEIACVPKIITLIKLIKLH